jgi:hypothetical protein
MRMIVEFDEQGLSRVDIVSTQEEKNKAHKMWERLRPELEQLDVRIKSDAAAVEAESDVRY